MDIVLDVLNAQLLLCWVMENLKPQPPLGSMNLVKVVGNHLSNGKVLPILHLNGYKISAPTLYGRKSERELHELIRGFGYVPLEISSDDPRTLSRSAENFRKVRASFLYPSYYKRRNWTKKKLQVKKSLEIILLIKSHYLSQKTDPEELKQLESWLEKYNFSELFDKEKGFRI